MKSNKKPIHNGGRKDHKKLSTHNQKASDIQTNRSENESETLSATAEDQNKNPPATAEEQNQITPDSSLFQMHSNAAISLIKQ